MNQILRAMMVLALIALAACGGPRRVLGPPTLSVQEVEAQDGHYLARVRLDSPASMPVTLKTFVWTLTLDGVLAARGTEELAQTLPPVAGDVVRIDLGPVAALPQFATLTTERSLGYVLEGELRYSEPNVRFPLRYEGRLRATPGKPGSFR